METNNELKAKQEYLKSLSKQLKELCSTLYDEMENIKGLSPFKVGDKVKHKNVDGVFYILQINVPSYSFDLEYMLSRPKKDGTMSNRSCGWYANVEQLTLVEKAE